MDFNGDGKADLLWHGADGSLTIWSGGASIYLAPPPGATLRGTGDWNGDGHTDLLWQTAAGAVETWTWGADHVAFTAQLGTLPRIQGIGDFDGNGRDDLLYQRSDGVWNTASAEARRIPVIDLGVIAPFNPDYHLVGTADFNGDGRDDMLFRGVNSVAGSYLIQQPVTVANRPDQLETAPRTFSDPGEGWSVLGLADFDGDKRADFLWQHTNAGGQVDARTLWATGSAGGQLYNPGADWSVVGSGDYDGDGKTDLMLHHTSGWYAEWLMDGAAIKGFGACFAGGDFWTLG